MPRIAQEFADFPYDELVPGRVWTSTYEISRQLVDTYNAQVGGGTADDTAPPWVFCAFLPTYRAMGGRMEQGSVHTRQTAEHFGATRVGEVLDVEVRVTDRFERRDRRHVVLETRFYGAERDLRCRLETTLLWGFSG